MSDDAAQPPTDAEAPVPLGPEATLPALEGAPAGSPTAAGLGGRSTWAALAALVALVGIVASLIGASTLAHHDASARRHDFTQAQASIAATLGLALQREEELAVSASTYLAHNPTTTAREFDAWVHWARTLHRFPELNDLGLVTIVRAPQLAAFAARTDAPSATERVTPAGARPYYCLAITQLVRSVRLTAPPGTDYCANSSALLLARDAGASYSRRFNGPGDALTLYTPVYRGNVVPASAGGRTAAAVGWLREVLSPGVVARDALRGHPGYAVSLGYTASTGPVAFTAGAPRAGAQHSAASLPGGWSLATFGPTVATGVLAYGDSLALLIGGCVASVLAGLLLFVGLGRPRRVTVPSVRRKTPREELYDALTGLPNRALSLDRAGRMVARAGRQSGLLAGALLIDVDWFKDINEKLGCEAGDQLLRIVAERLESVVRAGDTVGRYDGDEFVVLVETAARGVRLDSLARRMIESLHKPVELEGFGPSFFATASIGVAFGRYTSTEDLLRDARLALLAAKAAGKDRYTLFNANMRSVIESRAVLEAELDTALQDGQFFQLFEPVVELSSGRVLSFEALIHWRHPKRGVLGAEEFMELAEDTGLVVPIGRFALEDACARGAAWSVAGHAVGVSIKVSANQLNRDGFVIDVRRALQQSGIEPSRLTLEIAETTVMRDIAAVAARLREVKQMGVRIAIDDFGGSGYARQSDLRQLPVDVLKVDRGSLAASEDEDYRSWLFEAILIVGREMSLTVVASGVETAEQVESLQAAGCVAVQGPVAGPPVAPDAVEARLSGVPLAGAVPNGAPAGGTPAGGTPAGGAANGDAPLVGSAE